MTFEEFLAKKKIDLAQFKKAEPGLYSEFQSHYSQMGAKSFDHSKKFLFNKLRRTFHLKEEPKSVTTKEVIEVNEIASQAEPLLSPSVEATVYTPRFRAAGTPKKEDEESGKQKSESGEVASDKPKPAYTPRFKAQPAQSPEASPVEKTEQASQPAKPAFKPRFKPGMTGTTSAKSIEENKEEIPADKPKPAYIPRFKASVIANPAEEKMEETPGVKPKPGYVPRFKAPAKTNPSQHSDNSDL